MVKRQTNDPKREETKDKTGPSTLIVIIIVVIALLILGVSGYFLYKYYSSNEEYEMEYDGDIELMEYDY